MREIIARGGRWVAAQAVLFSVFASALWWGAADVPLAVALSGVVLAALGVTLSVDGLYRIRRHVTPLPAPVPGARLVEQGAYRLVRHPIYGGLIVATIGMAVTAGSLPGLAAATALGVFFLFKSRHEERLLERADPEYGVYRRRVPKRLIPWVL